VKNRELSLEKNYEILQIAENRSQAGWNGDWSSWRSWPSSRRSWGLLGTVIGMVLVFDVISQVGAGHGQELSSGISQALISTIAGLVVAIPALIAHSIYTRKVDNLLLKIEQAVGMLILKLYP